MKNLNWPGFESSSCKSVGNEKLDC